MSEEIKIVVPRPLYEVILKKAQKKGMELDELILRVIAAIVEDKCEV